MKIEQSTLANGLRIVTAELADARSATINVMAGVGSRYEDFATNGGVSHFLEHILFKGTKKYPTPQAIAEAVDAVGGFNNAYTAEDITSYHIKVPGAHTELALDILTDMMGSPLFDAEEIDRERDVIVEEMNVYRDDPARFVATMIPELLFPNNPLGRDILGSEEVINHIAAADIAAYQKHHYHGNNLVVAVAGQVKHDAIVEQVKAALGDLTRGQRESPAAVTAPLAHDLASIQAKDTAQAHFIIGSRAPSYTAPDNAAARLMAAILGTGMSSRLFTNVRERQGLAYFIYSEVSSYTDTGAFHAYAGSNVAKTAQAIESVLFELERLRHDPVTPAELAKAKQQSRASLEMSLESNGSIAERLGSQLILLDRLRSVDELIDELEAVTVAEVQAVAQTVLDPKGLRLALIAPEPEAAADHFKSIVTK